MMENQLQKKIVLVDDNIYEIMPDKPTIAPAIRGFPFVHVHKGKK
jgi:hypothetical protein